MSHRTVRDESGRSYVLLERSSSACRVRDLETGEERHLPPDELEPVGERPLALAARAVPAPLRRVLGAVHDDVGLGLLVTLDARGPLPARELLAATECCESDLHGRLAELVAADVVEERTVAGERGYGLTDDADAALGTLLDVD